MSIQPQAARIAPPTRWDIIVRASHWTLAVVVIGNALITRGGGSIHVWLGWVGLIVLGLRLVWGVVGRADARFAAFPPNPLAALRHLGRLASGRRPDEYRSHNPAGAMMAYALWLSLAVVTGTGLTMTKAEPPWTVAAREQVLESGDWSELSVGQGAEEGDGEDSDDGGMIKEIHESFANLMLILAVLHVAGVVLESRALRRNLIAPMLLGAKPRSPGR